METFHERLARLIAERGTSRRKLADALAARGREVSHTTVVNWAKSTHPSLPEAKELADLLGVTLEYLATGDEGHRDPSLTSDEEWLLTTARKVPGGARRLVNKLLNEMLGSEPAPRLPDAVIESVVPLDPSPKRSRSRKANGDHEGANGKHGVTG